MKKIFALILTVALLLTVSLTAFATETGNLSITRGENTYYYDYISEAFGYAEDGDVIKVERDYIEEGGIIGTWENDYLKDITFDLNGKEIHFPAENICYTDNGMVDFFDVEITFIDSVGGGMIHALVVPYEKTVVKGGTFRGFWAHDEVTIEGGTFIGLAQDIVNRVTVWDETEAKIIGTKGLLLTNYDNVFLSEADAREALDALIADGYIADRPYDITPYEMDDEKRYSAGFAANTTIVEKADYNTSVTYSVAPTYTVTIPTDVTVDGNATTVSAENVIVEKGKYVSVSLAENNNFTVATSEGATLDYTVKVNGENIAAGGEILAVNPENADNGTVDITFNIDESAIQYAGTYTGTAIFTVAVKDVPAATIINFTLDTSYIGQFIPGLTQNLQAEAGMTWGEWVESEYNVDGYVVDESWAYGTIGPAGEYWGIADSEKQDYVYYNEEIKADYTYDFAITAG